VPVRWLSNNTGAVLTFESKTGVITITKGSNTVVLTIDSNVIVVNDKPSNMDTSAIVLKGRTYVPIRFVAEPFGYTVGYQQNRDNSGNAISKANHLITLTDNTSTDTGTDLKNNITGVKTDIKLATDADLKSFWDSLDQDKFTRKTEKYVQYDNTIINKYTETSLQIKLNTWGDTEKAIMKKVLQNSCQNPQEVYDKVNGIFSKWFDNTIKEISDDWVKQNFDIWFTTGNVKYTVKGDNGIYLLLENK